MTRVIVFVDYWNFQLGWNRRAPRAHRDDPHALPCDFLALPREAVALADGAFGPAEANARPPLQLVQTRVYASHDPGNPKDVANRDWMASLMGVQDDFVVRNTIRQTRDDPARCRRCQHLQHDCPACGGRYQRASEKTVDAALIVDLLTLAWDDAMDVALLLSSDRDFLPPIDALRERGLRVINGRWLGHGVRLSDGCDAVISLDTLAPMIARDHRSPTR